jgi:hypothetical protein
MMAFRQTTLGGKIGGLLEGDYLDPEELASLGLYDLAGPLFAHFYEDWREATRSSRHPHHAVVRMTALRTEDWRALFFHTRDHHHSARFAYGLDRSLSAPEWKEEALRLAWPLAHDRFVWRHGRAADIDPYLVLALMRQESTYNAIAMSPVGARGAMQIMPRTGHLLAERTRDMHYTASNLEDPVFAVGYGITYLALLMERFGGTFPLAVSAYNAGPRNVSSWISATELDIPIDVFVEQIPLRETRNYVKQVSSHYATYLDLYAPEGTQLRVPPTPAADKAGVVEF